MFTVTRPVIWKTMGSMIWCWVLSGVRKINSYAAYRTGGDEFVIICPEPKNGQTEKIVSDWQKAIAAVPDICGVPVTAAVGFAEGSGNELEQVIRTAEQNMYADKQRYH